jgi:hypothetical protein
LPHDYDGSTDANPHQAAEDVPREPTWRSTFGNADSSIIEMINPACARPAHCTMRLSTSVPYESNAAFGVKKYN